MDEHLTVRDTVTLAAVFVAPFLLLGAVIQKVLPDPDAFGFGGPLLAPAFVATLAVTLVVRLFARRQWRR